jgi:hypothetical protein
MGLTRGGRDDRRVAGFGAPGAASRNRPAPPSHSPLAGLSGSAQATEKNDAEGADKGQANEAKAAPTKHGKHKHTKAKKPARKMKSGT